MYAIDVIPLAFLPRNQGQILTYFHGQKLLMGSTVEVTLGKRKIKGVVLSCEPLVNRKLTLKKDLNFQLKGISKILSYEPKVFNFQFKLANYISRNYYSPLGLTLKTILPPFWDKRGYDINIVRDDTQSKQDRGLKESFIITKSKNHFRDFEDKIKKALEQKKQVFLLVAEKSVLAYFKENYLHFSPLIISSDSSNKEQYDTWQKVISGKPTLIIGTRLALFLPFKNLGLIVVDDEANGAYKSDMTPRYNAPGVARQIALINGADFVISSPLPSLETYHKFKPEIKLGVKAEIIDMAFEFKSGNFSVLSRDFKQALTESLQKKSKILIYIPRRGYANFVLCQTCGAIIKCPNCQVSLVLHKDRKSEILKCHHCGFNQNRPKQCPDCQSYKLKNHGAGLDKVLTEIKRFFSWQNSSAPEILVLENEATSKKDQSETIEKFRRSAGALLLTTQLIFSYKYSIRADLAIIINGDALINIPDFRAEEFLFRQVYNLGQMVDSLLIQTYNPGDRAFFAAAKKGINSFFQLELKDRQTFGYPPFSKIIKLSYKNKSPIIAEREAKETAYRLRYYLLSSKKNEKTEIMGPAPAFIFKERGKYIWNILIKSSERELSFLNNLLDTVPSSWLVDVDPKSIV